jgi:hypothetical protein
MENATTCSAPEDGHHGLDAYRVAGARDVSGIRLHRIEGVHAQPS